MTCRHVLLIARPETLASLFRPSHGVRCADGAYDGKPVYQAVSERQPAPPVTVVILPRSTAVPSPAAGTAPSQRDRHIQVIGDKGRMG